MGNRSHKKVSQRTSTKQFDLFAVADHGARPRDSGNHFPATVKPVDASLSAAIRYVVATRAERGRPPKSATPPSDSSEPRLLDVREAARRLGLSKSTLDKMRCAGTGPRFIRATARAVRYDPADLDAFASARRSTSTMDEALSALTRQN